MPLELLTVGDVGNGVVGGFNAVAIRGDGAVGYGQGGDGKRSNLDGCFLGNKLNIGNGIGGVA